MNWSMIVFFCILPLIVVVQSQNLKVRWCVTSERDLEYCLTMEDDAETHNILLDIDCVRRQHKYDCMRAIEEDEADIMLVSPEEAYIAAEMHEMEPVTQEVFGTEALQYFVVVIARRTSNINSIDDLKSKKSCHTGHDKYDGWHLPLVTLMQKKNMNVAKCNDDLKNADEYFSQSCAPGTWTDDVDKKKNYTNLCSLCASSQNCNENDNYADYDGVVACLRNGNDIAFTRHTSIDLLDDQPSGDMKSNYQLICPDQLYDGTTYRPVGDYRVCNWGFHPTYFLMTRKGVSDQDKNTMGSGIKELYDYIKTFNPEYMKTILVSNDPDNPTEKPDSLALVKPDESTQFYTEITDYLGDNKGYFIETMKRSYCEGSKDENEVSFCVSDSKEELIHCEDLRDALNVARVMPRLKCVRQTTYAQCLDQIRSGGVDYANLEAGWAYRAGRHYEARPVLKEINLNQEDFFHSVAVARKNRNPRFNFRDLKGRKSCHGAYGTATGWLLPARALRVAGMFTMHQCQVDQRLKDFFNSGCAPGASTAGISNMCSNCMDGCTMGHDERLFGWSGALRGLVEQQCDVAFIKHTTIEENTNRQNEDDWAYNLMPSEFELLCPNGGFAEYNQWSNCNLGKIPSNRIVTQNEKLWEDRSITLELMKASRRLYGPSTSYLDGAFNMYGSPYNVTDTLFTDTTNELEEIPYNETWWNDFHYFDNGLFIRIMNETDPDSCRAGAANLTVSLLVVFFALLATKHFV